MVPEKKVMGVKCPVCGVQIGFHMPDKACELTLTCPVETCRKVFKVAITEKQIRLASGQSNPTESASTPKTELRKPTETVLNGGGYSSSSNIAVLVQKKRSFFGHEKTFELNMGMNTVGMHDPDDPSDIMIEGDYTISHRSISITVTEQGKSYKYLLTVNKATNPVKLGDKTVPVGTSIYIVTGQEILLGKTKLELRA